MKPKKPQPEKRDIRHGCVDCTHYPLPNNKEPCKSCERWSNWKDKREDNHGEVLRSL